MIFLISGVSLWHHVTGDIDLAIKKKTTITNAKNLRLYICRVHTKRRGGFIKMIVLGYEKILIARN